MGQISKSVKNRLYLGFSLVLVILLILVSLGISKVNYISDVLTDITDVNSVKQRYAINYRGSVHDRAIAFRDVTLADSSDVVAEQKKLIINLRRFYDEAENSMETMRRSGVDFSTKELEILQRISDIKQRGLPLTNKIISLAEQGDYQQATELVRSDAGPLYASWLTTINQFIDFQENLNQKITPLARGVADGFQSIMIAASIVALVVSILVARLIVNSLYRSLGGEPSQAAESLSAIANGDLTIAVNTEYQGSLLASLAMMRSNLANIVSTIISAGHDLSGQAIVVEDGSQKASAKASAQAELTKETFENLKVMKAKLDEIATIATNTEENSLDTSKYSKQGIVAVTTSSAEMKRIAETVDATVIQIQKLESTTKEIGSIVSVISSISDQTNLLALNAAIEAARAGESGRGFAVVADEVRELAKRTGSATNQIEKMINEVQHETRASVSAMETTQPLVESGRKLTSETAELLKKIEQQASASLVNVQEVALATKGQVDLINQVSSAMTTINNMASESIQSLQDNTDASKKLTLISKELNDSMNFFQVKN